MSKPQHMKPKLGGARQTLTRPAGSGSRAATLVNQYITTCKLCRYGVFTGQDKTWLTNPMGWSHTSCVKQAPL